MGSDRYLEAEMARGHQLDEAMRVIERQKAEMAELRAKLGEGTVERAHAGDECGPWCSGTAEVADCPVAAPAALAPPVILVPAALCLDLGSGPRPAPGFKGVDIVPGITDFCVELDSGKPWPFEDGTVEQFRSSHFIEHIRASCVMVAVSNSENRPQDAFFWFFDEAYRCAKPGATFQLIWPALKNARAFQDPTHRRFIPGETMLYLDAKWRELNGLTHYNVRCDWVCEAISPTIPDIEARAHQGEEGAKILTRRLAREWNLEQDTTATLRARK